MFDRFGALISRYWVAVIAAWLLLAVGLHLVAPRWNDVTHDGDLAYLPADMPSSRGARLIAKAFPDDLAKSEFAVVVERPKVPLSNADLLWSDSLAESFRERNDKAIVEVWNRNTDVVGDKLTSRISKNGQAAVTLLRNKNEFMSVDNIRLLSEIRQVLEKVKASAPAGLNVGISGSAAVGGDMLRSANESIKNTELTTIALVIVILLLVYRAPLLVSLPLVTIGVALVVSTDVLALLTQVGRLEGFSWWNFKIFTTTKIFIVVILFGAGTDFCLFLISRYKEELERGLDQRAAVAESVGRVGPALVGSAMTTVCGLGMMFFADFGKFSNSGPAIAMCLLITLAACLTLAPALLRAGGSAVFWPMGANARRSADALKHNTTRHETTGAQPVFERFWDWASRVIVRFPGLILMVSVLLLAPLASLGLDVRLTYDFLNELEQSCVSVQGAQMAHRHFGPGEMAPLTVLALKNGAHFDQAEGETQVGRLTKDFYKLDGIERVRSISEPMGDPPGYFQPFRGSGLKKLAARRHKITRSAFVTTAPDLVGDVARFDLVLKYEPFSPAALATVDEVQAYLADLAADPQSPWHDTQFSFAGTAAGIRDLRSVTRSDERLIQQLVVLSVLAVLLVLVRKPLVCCYLIASVLFSYFVTIGITQLFFAWLYGESFDGLDWKVPIFLFVILIAIGEDYNIYLVTRVLEEQRRAGQIEGLRLAVARTGGIITSCGLIMAGTFISMMTGTLRGMFELGFALSLGVMLDTCVVRPILVPAFLALSERFRLASKPAGPRDPESEPAAAASPP